MSSPKTPLALHLEQAEPLDPAEDAFAMRDGAIADLHDLGPPFWTDFNTHDPGVTFLDVLCYGLADLGYLVNSDVADLVAGPDGHIDFERLGLFVPRRIFPTSPISDLDYRKVILDEVPDLHNVWIYRPAPPLDELGFRGVHFLPHPGTGPVDTIARAISDCLAHHRALGDFFLPPTQVRTESLAITADIEDSPTTLTEALLDALTSALHETVTPAIEFDAVPLGCEDPAAAYDGPLLSSGFLRDEALWEPTDWETMKRRVIDAAYAVLTTHGARVRQLDAVWVPTTHAVPATAKRSDVSPSPPEAAVYRLDTTRSTVTVHYSAEDEGDPYPLPAQARGPYGRRVAAAATTSLPFDNRADTKNGYLDASRYRSIQTELPALYGLADPSERGTYGGGDAHVLQLKAYLSVFDQILASAHQRLASAGALLSPRADDAESWVQPIYAVPGVFKLLDGYTEIPGAVAAHDQQRRDYERNIDNPYRLALRAIATSWCHEGRDRRAVLQHLLARFGQTLPSQSTTTFETNEQLSLWLEDMPTYSTQRAKAADLALPQAADSLALSTLEQLAATILSLPGEGQQAGLHVHPGTPDGHEYTGRAHYLIEHGALLNPSTVVPASRPETRCPAVEEDNPPGGLRVPVTFFALRLSQLFTNWTMRPLTRRFQTYVENVLSQQTPAHLQVETQWLDAQRMRTFAGLYDAWAKAGYAGADAGQHARCCAGHVTIESSSPAAALVEFLTQPAS